MSTKAFAFSDTEKQTIGKTDDVKSSAARQAWKHAIDSVEDAGSFVAAAFRRRSVNSARKWRLVFFLVGLFIEGMARAEDADLLLTNGNVHTVREKQPKAEAIAVKANRIVFVGSNEDAKKFHAAKIVDLHGSTVVPGFTDSHCHIFGIGEREMRLNLEGTNSLEDFLGRVKERVDKTGPGKWISGRGWIETFWKPPQFPTRHDLDKIAPNNPVFLTRADGHASIANSAALKIARIDKNTPDPFGGQILKKNSEPNGMLLDNAQDLVARNIPKPTEDEREEALLRGIDREVKLGWCGIQNAGSHKEDVDLIRKAFETGKIKIRFVNAVYGPGEDAQSFLREGSIIDAFDHHFTQRTIKVLVDGALGSRGAALLKPYSDAPETSGLLRQKPEELRPMFEEALRRGIQVETHAIGDRANRLILDLYEQAFKAVPPEERKIREPRWRIEHAQIVDPDDIPRFAELGVIPSMQPSHAIGDLFFARARLGMDRLVGAYAWQSFIKSGCIIAGGSDAPVERGEPMIEFYAAVARKSIKGKSGEGWHPEQAVSRKDALKMFTIWPAYAAFQERDKGSIEVGKLADFTVLSQDIMKIPETEILETRNDMTVIGGEIIYSR
ncbi:MAG TPA: amidohydrolase [Candidatus Dormibacteraeota bacterium]|nr:amidohydrolase [Candidatus Dormibacteraeota bacterium]